MYSSNDFERLFIRYKAEAMPSGESIQSFCDRNKVPYNLFHKWYKDTRHKVVPVKVNVDSDDVVTPTPQLEKASNNSTEKEQLRILVDIRISNGMHIRQGNLSYDSLKRLVGNLEVLC